VVAELDHAITDFVEWYCSEPRLAFNRTVVLRYRIYLEQKQYAPTTINLAPRGPPAGRVRGRRFRTAQPRIVSRNPTTAWPAFGHRVAPKTVCDLLGAPLAGIV
jgi:hypothetical protein